MAMFNSFLYVYQRVIYEKRPHKIIENLSRYVLHGFELSNTPAANPKISQLWKTKESTHNM